MRLHDCKLCGKPFKRSRPDQNSQHFCSISCRLTFRLDKSGGDNSCWLWTGKSKHRFGYGFINNGGRVELTHRVAWTLANGEIPAGLQVLHSCDVPSCCNPAHLFIGTASDNVQDMVSKGRHGSIRMPNFGERISLGRRAVRNALT